MPAYNYSFYKPVGFCLGYFITFEGIEGCGKTTQIRLLARQLQTLGHALVQTREPGGCPIADKIRAILLDADNHAMQPLAELFLYAAARAQHVAEVVLPALKAGKTVLCDRFTDATIAYQSAGRGIELDTIRTLNCLACQARTPDLTILIDCDAATGLGRAKRRIEATNGPREERFEMESLAFHQRVRDSYLLLARQDPDRFLVVDGADTIENIARTISMAVLQRLENTHAVQ